jgi:hypothetical protein
MGRIAWTFALALGATLALSAQPADAAKSGKKQATARSAPAYVTAPSSFRGAYGYAPRGGGGINFSDGRMGANYNPNQGG